MNFIYHQKQYSNDILVYIEDFDKEKKILTFDFFDYRSLTVFSEFFSIETNERKASMVQIKNYSGKRVMEDTYYCITRESLQNLRENISNVDNEDSFILFCTLTFEADSQFQEELFHHPVSFRKNFDLPKDYWKRGGGNIKAIPIVAKGSLDVNIRFVEQGNWNEILVDGEVKICYDAGAPLHASKAKVRQLIGNRGQVYEDSNPGLFLSHWDKDHYHSLIGMTDKELSSLAYFVCRTPVPNVTSSILYDRIESIIGSENIYTIHAEEKVGRKGPTNLVRLNSAKSQLVIYNAEYHKNRNISGILLSLKTARASIVLPGDAHYEQISNHILPDLNFPNLHYLIVPHHGGRAGNYLYNYTNNISCQKAIISVGPNHYGHPDQKYIQSLSSDFLVEKTSKTGKDILINL